MKSIFKKVCVFAAPVILTCSPAFASYSYTPFELSEAAYRGYLKAENIPAYQSFCMDVKAGSVKGKDIVEAGIRAGYVDSAIVNEEYTYAVQSISRSICN